MYHCRLVITCSWATVKTVSPCIVNNVALFIDLCSAPRLVCVGVSGCALIVCDSCIFEGKDAGLALAANSLAWH